MGEARRRPAHRGGVLRRQRQQRHRRRARHVLQVAGPGPGRPRPRRRRPPRPDRRGIRDSTASASGAREIVLGPVFVSGSLISPTVHVQRRAFPAFRQSPSRWARTKPQSCRGGAPTPTTRPMRAVRTRSTSSARWCGSSPAPEERRPPRSGTGAPGRVPDARARRAAAVIARSRPPPPAGRPDPRCRPSARSAPRRAHPAGGRSRPRQPRTPVSAWLNYR